MGRGEWYCYCTSGRLLDLVHIKERAAEENIMGCESSRTHLEIELLWLDGDIILSGGCRFTFGFTLLTCLIELLWLLWLLLFVKAPCCCSCCCCTWVSCVFLRLRLITVGGGETKLSWSSYRILVMFITHSLCPLDLELSRLGCARFTGKE